MFGFLNSKEAQRGKLEKKYRQLLEESFKLSHTNRALADKKQEEALKVAEELEKLNKQA